MAHAFNLKFVRDKVRQIYSGAKNDPAIQIFEGRVNNPDSANPLDNWIDISETEAMNRLDYVEQNYSGLFTFFIRNKKGESYANAQKVVVQVGEGDSSSNGAIIPGGKNVHSYIQNEIARALKEDKLERKIAELEKRLSEEKKEDVPWGFFAQQAFTKFVMGQQPVAQINGANSAPTQAANGAAAATYEEPASEALNDSFTLILQALGEENVHKLALLTSNQALVEQFKAYLNSIPNT